MAHFCFSRIIVIESLNPNKTAKDLFDDIILIRTEQFGLKSEYHHVNNKGELIGILQSIKKRIVEKGLLPYLHLETHGNKEGISLIEGSISWTELEHHFREINILTKNNFFVSVAACFSSNIVEMVVEKLLLGQLPISPLFGLLGSTRGEIPESELAKVYSIYFNELFLSNDVSKAVKLLALKTRYKFEFGLCDKIFEKVMNKILNKYIKPRFKSPENAIQFLKMINCFNKIHYDEFIDLSSEEKIKEIFNSESYYLRYLNNLRDRFLMIDKYPENEVRFGRITKITGWKSNETLRFRKKEIND